MKLQTLNNIRFENIIKTDNSFSKHFHNTYTVGLTHDGIFKSINQNSAFVSYKNSTRIINPGEVHSGDSKSWKYTNFYPTLELMSEIYEQMYFEKKVPEFSSHIINDIVLYSFLLKFFISVYSNANKMQIETNLIEALSYLISNYTTKTKKYEPIFSDTKIIKNSIDFIMDNIETNITLEQLAMSVDLSKYHFLRVFKNRVGLTPHQFIISQRLEKAKELISKGVTLNEIAFNVGFSDQSHFIRNFKRVYGYAPSKLKNSSNYILYK
ncbi:AraC family transcriptional regulator [Malaciobacter molluscorum]|uniref:AraC family transcriptional regulator n=1 Tax=Malaciobacter molluscorum TaxID=1032072 RepID=UPI00100BFEC9|nr:AraC family transcriptional regulator [Malaciobacter molluscorum]RXJ96498.1 AraC family transcriptional regulator [Malaciobacter molluscorum]